MTNISSKALSASGHSFTFGIESCIESESDDLSDSSPVSPPFYRQPSISDPTPATFGVNGTENVRNLSNGSTSSTFANSQSMSTSSSTSKSGQANGKLSMSSLDSPSPSAEFSQNPNSRAHTRSHSRQNSQTYTNNNGSVVKPAITKQNSHKSPLTKRRSSRGHSQSDAGIRDLGSDSSYSPKAKGFQNYCRKLWKSSREKLFSPKSESLEDFRIRKEERVLYVQSLWRQRILPNWATECHSNRVDRLVWEGIPTTVRGEVWRRLIGNRLTVTPELFRILVKRSKYVLDRLAAESKSDNDESTNGSPSRQ
eukprot:238217_1